MDPITIKLYGFLILLDIAATSARGKLELEATVIFDPESPEGVSIPPRGWTSPAITMSITGAMDLQAATKMLLCLYTPPKAVAHLWPGVWESTMLQVPASWPRIKEAFPTLQSEAPR